MTHHCTMHQSHVISETMSTQPTTTGFQTASSELQTGTTGVMTTTTGLKTTTPGLQTTASVTSGFQTTNQGFQTPNPVFQTPTQSVQTSEQDSTSQKLPAFTTSFCQVPGFLEPGASGQPERLDWDSLVEREFREEHQRQQQQ